LQKISQNKMSNPIQAKAITLEEVQSLLTQASGRPPDPIAVSTIVERVRQRLMLEVWVYARESANSQIKALSKIARDTRTASKDSEAK
jgi:predicted ATP-grasp superfamily ATP-dependent carboligase